MEELKYLDLCIAEEEVEDMVVMVEVDMPIILLDLVGVMHVEEEVEDMEEELMVEMVDDMEVEVVEDILLEVVMEAVMVAAVQTMVEVAEDIMGMEVMEHIVQGAVEDMEKEEIGLQIQDMVEEQDQIHKLAVAEFV